MTARPRFLPVVALALFTAAILLSPSTAHAQRRGHRVGRAGGGAVIVAPRLMLGIGAYDPFWWNSWGPGWGGPGWWGPPFGPGFMGNGAGSARLQVTPREAEVYVDGYLAGIVDDFDGVFQRLDLPPGEHEITFYLDGYETVTEKLLFRPGSSVDVRLRLQPLPPGTTSGPRPVASRPPDPGPEPGGPPEMGRRTSRRPPPPDMPPPADGAFGTLAIRIQPADAVLLVDGEAWEAPDGDGPILIDLPEGPHEVEVRRDGRPPYRRTIDIRAGRTVPLNVSLAR